MVDDFRQVRVEACGRDSLNMFVKTWDSWSRGHPARNPIGPSCFPGLHPAEHPPRQPAGSGWELGTDRGRGGVMAQFPSVR